MAKCIKLQMQWDTGRDLNLLERIFLCCQDNSKIGLILWPRKGYKNGSSQDYFQDIVWLQSKQWIINITKKCCKKPHTLVHWLDPMCIFVVRPEVQLFFGYTTMKKFMLVVQQYIVDWNEVNHRMLFRRTGKLTLLLDNLKQLLVYLTILSSLPIDV